MVKLTKTTTIYELCKAFLLRKGVNEYWAQRQAAWMRDGLSNNTFFPRGITNPRCTVNEIGYAERFSLSAELIVFNGDKDTVKRVRATYTFSPGKENAHKVRLKETKTK